jgi:hypothetical protein
LASLLPVVVVEAQTQQELLLTAGPAVLVAVAAQMAELAELVILHPQARHKAIMAALVVPQAAAAAVELALSARQVTAQRAALA